MLINRSYSSRTYSNPHHELNRLICRAISNPTFASRLVVAPEDALADSEHNLSLDERAMVTSIRGAADIYDFAEQLYQKVNGYSPR